MTVAAHTEPTEPSANGQALVHLGLVFATVLLAMAGTYVVPGLERARPWIAGEPLPFETVIQRALTAGMPTVAPGTGDAYAATEPQAAEAITKFTAPPTPHKAGEAAIIVDPAEYADVKVSIEGREHLDRFYAALTETALGKAHAITRVSHYGDSSIASDQITYTMRRLLQQRFGDAGHGFTLISHGTMPYMHRDIFHRANDLWEVRQLVMNQDSTGRYGYGGVQFRSTPGASATFATSDDGPVGNTASKLEIFYARKPMGGKFSVKVDGGESRVVSTRGDEGDGFEVIALPDGKHRLDVRADGLVTLYGVVFERDVPGVVYDSLGMVGARIKRLSNFDPGHIASQLAHREPDLLVLGFGGNESADYPQAVAAHESEVLSSIKLMRAQHPTLPCLVFAPLDQAERTSRGEVRTMKSIPTIVAAQRRAAAASGCAFYDTWTAMGGEGAMAAWVKTRPRLALSDLRHATPEGYEVIGNMFYKALLQGFAEYVAKHPAKK